MSVAAAVTEEPTTDGSVFEGLFQRALRPTGEFAAALRAVGYDLEVLQPRYPTRVWRDCLEVARRFACPDLPVDQGYRELGRRFLQGFFATATGRSISVLLAMMSPEHAIQRLPRYWGAARTGVSFVLVEETRGRWRVTVRDAYPEPHSMASIMESGLRMSGAEVRAEVVHTWPSGFEVLVTWGG